jgi:hypothetical protein
MHDDLSDDCWTILKLAPGAEILEIHRAFEQLRLSCLPRDRDRTVPLSDGTKERLQQLDRAFFQALETKNVKTSLTNTALTKPLAASAPTKPQVVLNSSMHATPKAHAHPRGAPVNLTTGAPPARFCAFCRIPISSWSKTNVCQRCQQDPLKSKNTSVQNHSIASDDLISARERSHSLGGLSASFSRRSVLSARWIAACVHLALVFILQRVEQFSRLRIGVRAFLGGTLALAIAWLLNILGGASGLTTNSGGDALFVGVLLGILLKYRWWLLSLGSIFLAARYFH